MPPHLVPAAGMNFSSYDQVREFYNTYARHAGFGTRKRSTNSKNNYIVYSRQGIHIEIVPDYERKRAKTSKRTGCQARIRVKRKNNGRYVIEEVELKHNHKMIDRLGMLSHMRSHKRDDPLIDQLVKDMQMDNHTHTQVMSTLSRMSGGLQYMGHTSCDWVNKKQQFAREESEDDVKKLLDYFEKMNKLNPELFYEYNKDADNRVRNIFWANTSCRGSYEDFGDCVTFDTTYKTKQFHMPLGVFMGVNHHLQSMIFAVALV